MKFNWIIQRPVFDSRLEEAKGILESLGDSVKVCPSDTFDFDPASLLFDNTNPTIVMGSIFMCNALQHQFSDENLETSYPRLEIYYSNKRYNYDQISPFISGYCLNEDYNLLPLHEFENRFSVDFDKKKIFIRPNSGSKSFSGTVLTPETFISELNMLRGWGLGNELIVYSSYKKIDSEFRFWIIGNEISTYSEYKLGAGYDFKPSKPPKKILRLAEEFACGRNDEMLWAPDVSFTIDLCMCKGKAKVVEVNALSTSGVYWCDLKKLFTDIKDSHQWEYGY
jgi:hypothetical protein